jgi:hypothetical protein
MNGLFLHSLDLQGLQLLIKNLALRSVNCGSETEPEERTYKIHNDTLMD